MYKIGEFSKICHVTVKALRHYDELDLFKPVRVDPDSGYRFYSASQLPRLNRLLAFKDLGLSLEEIGRLLDGDVTVEQMRGMLIRKQVELKHHIHEESARLARVEIRLKNIERGALMTDCDVTIKETPDMIVAGIRRVVPTYADVGVLFKELEAFFMEHKALVAGPCLSRCFDEEYRERDVDLEALVPLKEMVPESGDIKVYRLPGETVASAIHTGPYEKLFSAYQSMLGWMEDNDWQFIPPNREIYIVSFDQTQDTEKFVTELQIPIRSK